MGSQIAPIAIPESFAEDGAITVGWGEVTCERGEKRAFARAVWTEEDPVLAGENGPREALEDLYSPADDEKVLDLEDRRSLLGHRVGWDGGVKGAWKEGFALVESLITWM